MKDFSDDMSEMRTRSVLDDATVEAILTGGPTAPEHAPLADVVHVIRNAGTEPVEPSRQLASCMAAGDFGGIASAPLPHGRHRVGGRARSMLAAMSLRARAATGVAILFTGLSGATAAGALPDAWEEKVQDVIETVTPISFGERNDFGQAVSGATQHDGVDGHAVSEAATEKGKRGGSLGAKPDPDHPRGVPPSIGRPEDPGEEGRENRPENPGEEGRENRPDNPGEEGRENRPDNPGEEGAQNRPDNPAEQGRERQPDNPGGDGQQTPPDNRGEQGLQNRPGDSREQGRESRPENPGNGKAENKPDHPDGGQGDRPKGRGNRPTSD